IDPEPATILYFKKICTIEGSACGGQGRQIQLPNPIAEQAPAIRRRLDHRRRRNVRGSAYVLSVLSVQVGAA
ncbi:MAG: hypothetical protein J2P53_12485, partial [Bradyrhizobiaceae bacterium]|nr:hypothetical protein [Bradyrhizobiaceae bacterium]